ncbi:MAG TPA: hypothetical protein P5307_20735, partial [Pirellulaceae bacterium]|nr:hypothetical protein [Pirellulaceae bacterium]
IFDADEDGALTVDEVPERLWERISQADANEDGTVTADELAASLSAAGAGDRRHPRGSGGHHRRHGR